MKPTEVREKTAAERAKLLAGLRQERFNLKVKMATGQLEKNHQLKAAKRDIARLMTIRREKGEGVS